MSSLYRRVALASLLGGLLSSLAWAPWARVCVRGAMIADPAGWALAWLGAFGSAVLWERAGAWVAGEHGRRAWAWAMAAGALAAGVSACLVVLPSVEIRALPVLWVGLASGNPRHHLGSNLLDQQLARSLQDCVWWFWSLLGAGALAGGLGALRIPPGSPLPVRAHLLWPLLVARVATLSSLGSLTFGVWLEGWVSGTLAHALVNGALCGSLGASLLLATAVRHVRHPLWAYRMLGWLYALDGALSLALWVGLPLYLFRSSSLPVGLLAVWCVLPALAAAVGAWWGARAAPGSPPEWRELLDEALLLAPASWVLLMGPGLGSVFLAASLFETQFLPAFESPPRLFSVPATLRALFVMHAQTAPAVMGLSALAAALLLVPLLGSLRWLVRRARPAVAVDQRGSPR